MLLPFFDGNIMLIVVIGNVLENEIRNIFTPLKSHLKVLAAKST